MNVVALVMVGGVMPAAGDEHHYQYNLDSRYVPPVSGRG